MTQPLIDNSGKRQVAGQVGKEGGTPKSVSFDISIKVNLSLTSVKEIGGGGMCVKKIIVYLKYCTLNGKMTVMTTCKKKYAIAALVLLVPKKASQAFYSGQALDVLRGMYCISDGSR